MAKKQIEETRTEVVMGNGVGRAITQTQTIDDSCLPSPAELEQFMKINPNFANHFMQTARDEQHHRHKMENDRMSSINQNENRKARTQRFGMSLAAFLMFAMLILAGVALWLDRPWFSGITLFVAMLTIIATFLPNKSSQTPTN